MKTRLFLPVALAALTAGTGLLALSQQADAQQNVPGQTRKFRLEFKNDGTKPRFWQNGQELPNPFSGGADVQDNPMAELLRRLMESGEADRFKSEDWFKHGEEDRENAPKDRGNRPDGSDGPVDPQRMMEEMLRRMGRGGNPDGLGFGPGAREELPRTSKHHLSSLAEWRPLAAQARQSTVRVLRKNKQVALGTIVSADGYALTKASEVESAKSDKSDKKSEIEVEFGDGRIVTAEVVDTMKAYDLALIKIEATGLTPARFADTETPVGTLIAAVTTGEDVNGVGVISVAARSLDERSKGFLGISMSRDEPPAKGVLIGEVIDGGAAKRAGIEAGDVILSVNNEEILNPRQLQKLVAGLKPDQKVKVQIERAGKPQELELSLGNRAEVAARLDQRQFDQTALMGSSLSKNASGYPNAVQSDLALQAEDAGGPVIDVNGAIVGLNIARSERVSTYLIPGKIVNALLTDVQSGKFALSKDADTLTSELREINSTIQKAQEAMKKAEEERDAALKALEKLKK
ncbi:MAG: mucD 6 [Verrucomicrobiales bacterium]|nr:mucD 6 [Verrucomicrobiales bacterium]